MFWANFGCGFGRRRGSSPETCTRCANGANFGCGCGCGCGCGWPVTERRFAGDAARGAGRRRPRPRRSCTSSTPTPGTP
jgi:hypothetical protein